MVDLSTYRARIGLFQHSGKVKQQDGHQLCLGKWMIAFAVLTFLLHIGGIEKNPGPRNFNMEREIRQMKNDILGELRKIHDDLGTVKEKCNNLEKTCGLLEQRQCEMATFMKTQKLTFCGWRET